ncbi:hypothetical protein DL771_005158 [Monosporascus sp. 5C6A]|nr:hypothetical protein DL771_005158 [Monosporascus sp. 5C6A]
MEHMPYRSPPLRYNHHDDSPSRLLTTGLMCEGKSVYALTVGRAKVPKNRELFGENLNLRKQVLKDYELLGRNLKEGKLRHCALAVEGGYYFALFGGSQPLYAWYGASPTSELADLGLDDSDSMSIQPKWSVEKTEGSADAKDV